MEIYLLVQDEKLHCMVFFLLLFFLLLCSSVPQMKKLAVGTVRVKRMNVLTDHFGERTKQKRAVEKSKREQAKK